MGAPDPARQHTTTPAAPDDLPAAATRGRWRETPSGCGWAKSRVRELSWQGYEIVAGKQELYQKHFSEIFTDSQSCTKPRGMSTLADFAQIQLFLTMAGVARK